MFSETRSLIFPNETLLRAMTPVAAQRGFRLPQDGSATISIRMAREGDGIEVDIVANGETHTFTGNEVGAGLILFCMENRVPLPKEGSKTVEWRGDNVALIVRCEVPSQKVDY